jgi:mRNA interferase MazF
MPEPKRGDIWWIDLDPTRGREQAGKRPGLIISVDEFNGGPADLVVLIPITSKQRGVPLHVEIRPPEGGVKHKSFVKCEDVRSVSKSRLLGRLGGVKQATMEAVEERLQLLLGL